MGYKAQKVWFKPQEWGVLASTSRGVKQKAMVERL